MLKRMKVISLTTVVGLILMLVSGTVSAMVSDTLNSQSGAGDIEILTFGEVRRSVHMPHTLLKSPVGSRQLALANLSNLECDFFTSFTPCEIEKCFALTQNQGRAKVLTSLAEVSDEWSSMHSGVTTTLTSVWGSNGSDITAVGQNGTILQYDGNEWNEISSGITNTLRGVWRGNDDNGFAVGDGGTILQYDGSEWIKVSSEITTTLRDVWGSSGNDVFAVGDNGVILHYNGVEWSLRKVGTSWLSGVWGSGSNDVFAVGDSGTIMHYDGSEWNSMIGGGENRLYGVGGSNGNNVYATSDGWDTGNLIHYDGSEWNVVDGVNAESLSGVWASDESVFAMGWTFESTDVPPYVSEVGVIAQLSDSGWNHTIVDITGNLNGVWGSDMGEIFAVGGSGTILHYNSLPTYTISGQVYDSAGNPISNVTISDRNHHFATTDDTGTYTITGLFVGTYLLRPGEDGYRFSPTARVVRVPPDTDGQDFTTEPVYGNLSGQITDHASGTPIAKARVSAGGNVGRTDTSGNYSLTDILPGLHNVHVLADGYQDYKSEVVIEANTSTVKEVTLKPINTDGYYLPYPGGKTYQCTQSNNNKGGSHQGTWRYAFDFGMPDGHEVVASQDGRVIAFRENSNKSCNSKACIDDANYVRIRHQDGTDTLYYHLNHQSVSVNVGDIVVRGQMIAQSDTTGWCTGAHLDFTRHKWGEWESVPISFVDIAGNGMPQAGNSYTSGNYPPSRVIRAPTATTDTEPPQGSVSFHLTGHPTHTLQLQAADYLTDVTSLRLAVREADLQAATWLSFTTHTVWTDPAVFAQFQDANGNISGAVSDTVDAIGYEPIQAAFAVDPKVCVGQGLSLTNQTTPFCEQCGWLWSFGDGSTSKKANPEFDYVAASSFAGYAAPGMYTVTLTATNAISTSVASHEVEALAGPSSDFTVVQTGDAITVEAAAATDAHYIWNFGDGVTATGRIATHTYADTTDFDTYPVQLRVEGQHGCKSSSHQFLITPPTTLDITGPITGMVEEPYTFTATINTTATRPITYTWDFEGHPIMTHTEGISDTAVFSWTTSGLRQLIVTATNAGGMIASAHSITIYPSVQVDFEATPTDGFAPVTVVFTNTSAGDYTSSLWNFGDGVTSTLEAPTHTYELPGAYTVTLRVNEPGSTDTLTRTDYIAVYEPIQASFTGSPREGVSPFIVHFTNTTTGPAAAWMWDFGDGEISTLQHPTHTYEAAGVYTISLTAQAAGGSALWPGGTDTLSRPSYITIKRTFDVFLPLVIRSS